MEQIFSTARATNHLSAPYSNISLFVDLSPATMEICRAYTPITSILKEHKITYQWGFPTKLLVTNQQKFIPILTPKHGYKTPNKMGFTPYSAYLLSLMQHQQHSTSSTVTLKQGGHRLTSISRSAVPCANILCLGIIHDLHLMHKWYTQYFFANAPPPQKKCGGYDSHPCKSILHAESHRKI